MLLDVAEVSDGTLVKRSWIVPAVLSARLVKVAMPPDAVTVSVSSSASAAACQRRRHLRAVITCFQVARLVLDINHGLGGKRRPAVAVPDGWVCTTSLAAAAGVLVRSNVVSAAPGAEALDGKAAGDAVGDHGHAGLAGGADRGRVATPGEGGRGPTGGCGVDHHATRNRLTISAAHRHDQRCGEGRA